MAEPKITKANNFTLSIQSGTIKKFVPIGVAHPVPKFELPPCDIEIDCNIEGKINWVTFWHLQALTAPPN